MNTAIQPVKITVQGHELDCAWARGIRVRCALTSLVGGQTFTIC